MKIRNTSRFGDLDVPLLGRVVAAGETVAVTDDQARRLLPQADTWHPADKAATALADELALDALLDAAGLALDGDTETRLARLAEHHAQITSSGEDPR